MKVENLKSQQKNTSLKLTLSEIEKDLKDQDVLLAATENQDGFEAIHKKGRDM